MLNKIKAVILDYPKSIIQDESVNKIFADIIQAKQINFAKTDPEYIPLSGLDMASTHFLLYDTSNVHKPKLIFAIRTCYSDRVYRHKLQLPIDEYSKWLNIQGQKDYRSFRKNKDIIADVNAWFVDPDYSYKKSGLNLSEFGFFMVVSHCIKRGIFHFVGATNEKYKASRWVEKVGQLNSEVHFTHKKVEDPHRLILLEPFNLQWFEECKKQYLNLYLTRQEIGPLDIDRGAYLNDSELFEKVEAMKSLEAVKANHVPNKRVA